MIALLHSLAIFVIDFFKPRRPRAQGRGNRVWARCRLLPLALP